MIFEGDQKGNLVIFKFFFKFDELSNERTEKWPSIFNLQKVPEYNII